MRRLAALVLVTACSRPQADPVAGTASVTPVVNPPPASSPPPTPATAAATGGCDTLFARPADAEPLCDQHVMSSDPEHTEIHWQSWAVTTTRLETFDPYRARASGCGAGFTFKPPILSVSKDDTRLAIYDIGETGYPSCDKKPSPDKKSVVIVSVKTSLKRP